MPSAESQIHSPALLGLPVQEGLLYSISEVQSIPLSKCCVWSKGTDCLSWCSWHYLSENHHVWGGPQCDLVVSLKGGREKSSFKYSLLLKVMATGVSLELWTWSEGQQELSLSLASHGLLCYSVVTMGSVVVNHQASNRSAMRHLCVWKNWDRSSYLHMYKVPHLNSSMVGHVGPWTGPSFVANSSIFFSL